MRNKRGGSNTFMVLGVIAVIALLGFMAFKMSTDGSGVGIGSSVADCNTAPYLDVQTFNAYSKSTNLTNSMTYYYILEKRDGKAIPSDEQQALTLTTGASGTKFQVGDEGTLFTSAGSYLDRTDKFQIKSCANNVVKNYISGADGTTMDILDENLNAVSDGVTATTTNITASGVANNVVNYIVRFVGVGNEESGDLYFTIEGNDSQVDDFKVTSRVGQVKDTDAPILDLFASEGTSPTIKKAFVLSSVVDGATNEYGIQVIPDSGDTLGEGANLATGFLYHNAYAGEWFIQDGQGPDAGKFVFGWESADGVAKYETALTDHDALIE